MVGWGEESAGNDTDTPEEAENDLMASLTGLELRGALSDELPGTERGRGRGRLLLVGEVGEGEGSEGRGCVGRVTAALGSNVGVCDEWLRDCGGMGTGVGPGVGRGGRNGEVNCDGGAPGVGNGLREKPLKTGLVGGDV